MVVAEAIGSLCVSLHLGGFEFQVFSKIQFDQ